VSQLDAAPDHGAASDSGAGREKDSRSNGGGQRPGEAAVRRDAAAARPDEAGPRPSGGDAGASRAASGPARVLNVTRATVVARDLEIGSGLWAKFMGLMGRDSLPEGRALWLPESNGIHMMFMRFPIDAVFVGRPGPDGTRRVVSIHRSLPVWSGLVPLVRGAHGVLELPVGTIDASATEVGDRLSIG